MADTHKEGEPTHASSSTMGGDDGQSARRVSLLPALDRDNVKVHARVRLDPEASQLQLNLPRVSLACSIETSFVIVQWLRGGAVACDYDFPTEDDDAQLVRTACLAVGAPQIKQRYREVAERFMERSASEQGLPEGIAAFGFLVRSMPQFCFTTGEVEWCANCEEGLGLTPTNIKRRFCVSFADRGDEQLAEAATEHAENDPTGAGLSTPADICDVFFKANPMWGNRCGQCNVPRYKQIRVLDRLPVHLVVEDSGDRKENNIFEMCAGCDVTYTDGGGGEHCVKYPVSVASALAMLEGGLHFVALLHREGVAKGAVLKDVQSWYAKQERKLETREEIEKLRKRVTYTVLRRSFEA